MPGFSAAGLSLTVEAREAQAAPVVPAVAPALLLVLRADTRTSSREILAGSRIRARPASSPADRVPSIQRALALPALAPWLRVAPALAPALALVPALDLALVAREASALLEVHRQRAKHRAHRVLQGLRVAVDVSSIPRPRKAR